MTTENLSERIDRLEREAMLLITKHLNIASYFASKGKRGLFQYHTAKADDITESLMRVRATL